MFLIEIALAATAWRKGYGPRALRPFGYALGIAILMGIAVGAGEGSVEKLKPLFILLDIGVVAALLRMIHRAPKQQAGSPQWQPADVQPQGEDLKVLHAELK